MKKYIFFVYKLANRKGDLMIKKESLQKRLVIAAVAGILMLLLSGSSFAQNSLEIAVPGRCTSCSSSVSVGQTEEEASSLTASENGLQEMNLSDAQPKIQPGNSSPLYPMGLISNPTPTFNWTAAYNASKYNLQVYSDNSIAENASLDAGESLVANESFDAENVTHGSLCSELLSVYLPDGIYFWHVQACNDEVCGYWSQWQYFENICALKPDEAQENKVTARNGMRPEKDTVEEKKAVIEAEKEMIEARIAAQEKRIALNRVKRSGCNCGSAD